MATASNHRGRALVVGSIAVFFIGCFVAVIVGGGRGRAITIEIERITVSQDGEFETVEIWTRSRIWRDVQIVSSLRAADGTIHVTGVGEVTGGFGLLGSFLPTAESAGCTSIVMVEPGSVQFHVHEGESHSLRIGEELVLARCTTGSGQGRQSVEAVKTALDP